VFSRKERSSLPTHGDIGSFSPSSKIQLKSYYLYMGNLEEAQPMWDIYI